MDVEDAFEDLLQSLRPSRSLFAVSFNVFNDIWHVRVGDFEIRREKQKASSSKIDSDIRKAADRLVETESAATERTLKAKPEQMDSDTNF